jgi:class 3 adenylate cyclase
VIGDSVNLSSRLESLCKKVDREYLISGATQAALSADLASRFPYLARVKVKGKETAVPVHAYQSS